MKTAKIFFAFCVVMVAARIQLVAGEPRPADLIDLETIRNLSLSDLGWYEKSREAIDGVLVLKGSWTGPTYRGTDANGSPAVGELNEAARVWIPLARPANTEIAQIVWARHEPQYLDRPLETPFELPGRLPVAFLLHGQEPEDWSTRGFSGTEARTVWANYALGDLRTGNPCTPGDYRSNYPVSLVETQLMALTLLSRLLEGEGYEPGLAAMRGISKEGWSTWFASAVDDRIVAAAPGGWHIQDWLDAMSVEISNTGLCGSVYTRILPWAETAAGSVFLEYFSVAEFVEELKPEFLLIHGDVGLRGMHDGDNFSTGMETRFLETFSALPFRYDRWTGAARESRYEFWDRGTMLLAHYLLTGDTTPYAKVVESSVVVDASSFRASARVDPAPDLAPGAVRLWWSHSTKRKFRGAPPWVPVDMSLEGDTWVSAPVDLPAGMMIGWYVEAESTLDWEGFSFAQRDASPQRFFNEFPPLTCSDPPPDCPDLGPDRDNDGLVDEAERAWAGSGSCPDPDDPDSDGDGLLDGREVLTVGTDPCNPDSDGDGRRDGIDSAPLDSDRDNDGVNDSTEVLLAAGGACPDPDDADSDDDTFRDGFEIKTLGSDPCSADTAGVVDPWTSIDIGDTGFSGRARYESDDLVVLAGGRGLAGQADSFHLVHQAFAGDVMLTARISDLSPGSVSSVGLMLRESLAVNAKHASILFSSSGSTHRMEFARRRNLLTIRTSSPNLGDDWVRIERRGNEFIGYHSPSGILWTELGRVDIELPEIILGGIAVTAINTSGNEIVFTEVANLYIGDPPAPRFIRGDGNGDGRVNIADPSYIAGTIFGLAFAPITCEAAADANGDGGIDIADPSYIANFLFGIGPAAAPPAPYPDCALVAEEEPLSCLGTEGCFE